MDLIEHWMVNGKEAGWQTQLNWHIAMVKKVFWELNSRRKKEDQVNKLLPTWTFLF